MSSIEPTLLTVEEELQRRKRTGASVMGKLRTGVVASNGGAGAKSSIPTRFETILHTGAREHNAFGRRTYRFEEPENELPGPGAYGGSGAATFVKTSQLSFSKKGSAAFAKQVGVASVHGRSCAPGPGAYFRDVVPSDPAALDKHHQNAGTRPHPVFCAPVPKPVIKPSRTAAPVPGPGQYFPEGVPTTLKAPCTAMCARSNAQIGAVVAAAETSRATSPNLGPGAYLRPEHYSMQPKDAYRPSHFSLSGTSRFGQPKHHAVAEKRFLSTALPPILASSADVDRLGVPQVVSEVRGSQRGTDSLRNHTAPVATNSPSRSTKPSFMFSETNLDRFGRPLVRYTAPPSDALGPGSYDLESKPKRMLISSSWALSGSSRDELHDRYLPPGPAYYSPPGMGHRVSHRVADPSVFVA